MNTEMAGNVHRISPGSSTSAGEKSHRWMRPGAPQNAATLVSARFSP